MRELLAQLLRRAAPSGSRLTTRRRAGRDGWSGGCGRNGMDQIGSFPGGVEALPFGGRRRSTPCRTGGSPMRTTENCRHVVAGLQRQRCQIGWVRHDLRVDGDGESRLPQRANPLVRRRPPAPNASHAARYHPYRITWPLTNTKVPGKLGFVSASNVETWAWTGALNHNRFLSPLYLSPPASKHGRGEVP